MNSSYENIADILLKHKNCIVLTGSGISVDSGIQTFRSKGGLWEQYDPAVYCSIEVFQKDPSKYWLLRGDF
ncbi:MAG: Sir2 family NAD-dependent protein deacetylase, partial [Candidatus Kariarchaeaceae archaeon]